MLKIKSVWGTITTIGTNSCVFKWLIIYFNVIWQKVCCYLFKILKIPEFSNRLRSISHVALARMSLVIDYYHGYTSMFDGLIILGAWKMMDTFTTKAFNSDTVQDKLFPKCKKVIEIGCQRFLFYVARKCKRCLDAFYQKPNGRAESTKKNLYPVCFVTKTRSMLPTDGF